MRRAKVSAYCLGHVLQVFWDHSSRLLGPSGLLGYFCQAFWDITPGLMTPFEELNSQLRHPGVAFGSWYHTLRDCPDTQGIPYICWLMYVDRYKL